LVDADLKAGEMKFKRDAAKSKTAG
jgi:hypothetical protein